MNILGLYAASSLVVLIMVILFIVLAVVGVVSRLSGNIQLSKRCGLTMLVMVVIGWGLYCVATEDETTDTPSAFVEETTDNKELTTRKFGSITETVGNWEITVNNFEFSRYVEAGFFLEYSPKGKDADYFIIDMSVKNLSKTTDVFLPTFADSEDTTAVLLIDDYEYPPTSLLFSDTLDLCSCQLNPLINANGMISFLIPSTVAFSKESITLVISCSSENVSFTLR